MAWIADHFSLFPTALFKQYEILSKDRGFTTTIVSPSLEARITPVAPTFTVQAGQIAYVGDLNFDFSTDDEVRWSHAYDETAACAAIVKTGLADRVADQPMTRENGQPIGPHDAFAIKK